MATNKHYLVQSFEPSQTITNEVHTVLDGKFLLDYIPDQLIRVSITGYTQIPWNNAITSATQFKVNYQNGEVQVHSSKEGVSITVTSYGAKGIIKYYADRIVLDNGETIQNKVSSLSSVIESIETADSNAQIGVYTLIASGTNTYTTSYTGLTYYSGLKISLTISVAQKNTGASTLNINSLGDKYIKYYDGNGNKQSLTGGELVGKVLLEYDGSEFVILSNNAYINAHLADSVSDVDGAHGLKVESGTWTPTLSGGNHTYFERSGVYYKIGKAVTIRFNILLQTKDGGMTGNAVITGLPFAANGVFGVEKAIFEGVTMPSGFTTDYVGYLIGTHIELRCLSNGSWDNIKAENIGGNARIYASAVYFVE